MVLHPKGPTIFGLVMAVILGGCQSPNSALDSPAGRYLAIARERIEHKDVAEADAALKRAEEIDPNLAGRGNLLRKDIAAGYLERGTTRMEEDDPAGAIADLSRALELQPDLGAAFQNRGLLRIKNGDAAKGLADLDQAVRLLPEDASCFFLRAQAKADLGDANGAIADLDRSISLDPKNALSRDLRGNLRMARKDFAGAIEDFDEAIASDPTGSWAYNNRGCAKKETGDFLGSIADFTQALMRKEDPGTYVNRGDAFIRAGQFEQASADLSKALALKPNLAEVHRSLAYLSAKKGNLPSAIASYGRYLEKNPNDARALFDRGTLRACTGDLAGGLADISRAIEIMPDFMEAYVHRGNIRADQGDRPAAIADYTRAIELRPTATAYSNRANQFAQLGNMDAAATNCDKALSLDPGYLLANWTRGNVRFVKGNFEGAIVDFDAAIQLGTPNSERLRFSRILALRLLRRDDGSIELSRVAAKWPDEWMKTIAHFLLGELGEPEFLKAASAGSAMNVEAQKRGAFYYAGMMRLIRGDNDGARVLLERAKAASLSIPMELALANAALQMLGPAHSTIPPPTADTVEQ